MTVSERELEDLMATALIAGMPSTDVQAFIAAHPKVLHEFAGFDPFKLTATFGGLLTTPELQSNCLRLEALCHLSLLRANGRRKPSAKVVTRSFAALTDGPAGHLEDPAEDVFVSSVATKRGNFRVLEGIWESAGFFLQRFLNVIEDMPDRPGYADIRESVFALLKLSDLVCARAKLVRWQMGAPYPIPKLPSGIARSLDDLRARVTFTQDELNKLGIPLVPLTEFVFRPRERPALAGETIGHTRLERYPVLWRDTNLCLALPTAVSAAIRRFILERMDEAGMRERFVRALGREYTETFSGIPLLGGEMHAPIEFQGPGTAVMIQVDPGRYLNLLFVLDTLEGVETSGIAGINDGFGRMQQEIAALTKRAADAAQQDPDFQDGVTVYVSCGIGRAVAAPLPNPPDPRWRQEFLSAADLATLSWTEGFNPLALWRLLDAGDQVAREGVHLANVNGLLNLVAWQRQLKGSLVPHNQIPDDFVTEGYESLLMIDQTALKSLRSDVAVIRDFHVAQDVTGVWVPICKLGDDLFKEDAALPLYTGTDITRSNWPPAIYLAPSRSYWCEMVVSENTTRSIGYERWKMLNVWLARIAVVLDARVPTLPDGPVVWRVEFKADLGDDVAPHKPIGFEEAKRAITVTAHRAARTVTVHVGEAYERAHFNVENIAERALVERTLDGFLELAGVTLTESDRAWLVTAIIPDARARQLHAFRGRTFRDHVRQDRSGSVIFIDEDDSATLRLGLGWRNRDRKDGSDIYGKRECTAFLNAVTRMLEDELASELATFNRTAMIKALLYNHEQAAISRDQWTRTASAVISLHADKEAAFDTITRQEFRLNAVSQSARTLIEVAQCNCPEGQGRKPGELDLSRLMARMGLIIHMGGWSGAIWHDAMEPRIRINSLGDIQVNHDFIETVIEPFGRAASDERTRSAIGRYADHLSEVGPRKSVDETFEPEFLDAFREECGAGLRDVLTFIDFVEDLGVKHDRLVLALPRSALLAPTVGGHVLPSETAAAIVRALVLPRRDNWRTVPKGYDEKDLQPWRYRRRLSLLRKPLVQLDDQSDPTIMLAPGLLREGLVYALSNYHRGDFPQWQLSPKMKSWRGKASDKRGTEFNTEVAERLTSLGWQARPNVNMSAILGSGFKSLGDIDVLAWNPRNGRVLLIECKNVKFSKTIGEIAEQLADFRGELRGDGRPDDLLKHLNRVEAISKHLPELSKFIRLNAVAGAEGHVVFRNPVPMQFAWERLKARIGLQLFDALADI